MQKAAVTGGGGFIGLAIVRKLLEQDIEPVVIGRSKYEKVDELGVETHQGDIRDLHFLNKALVGCDTVFHVAAKAGIWGPKEDFFSINVTGTENVIKACRDQGIQQLVHTSSPSVVFNRVGLSGVSESTPYAKKFLCYYAQTKALAEQKVLAANELSGLKTTAIRPHLVWGPGDNHLLPRLIEQGKKGRLRQVGNGQNLVDITYIDNAVHAHLLAAKNLEDSGSAAGRAYFISQGEPVHLWSWINTLFQRLGIPRVQKRVSYTKAYWAGTIFERIYKTLGLKDDPPMTRFLAEQLAKPHWFSLDRAERELGYEPLVNQVEGLNRTVKWLRSNAKY